jgi:serine/threonine protein kinase
MDSSRWQRIESIFNMLADLPSGHARDERLEALTGGDGKLAAEVLALLETDALLETPEFVAQTSDPGPADDRHVGLRLGSYQVGDLIAHGGMSSVYRAERADDHFHQSVAVKIMDVRLSDEKLVASFRAERQILAALEHVNLTRLIDGGVTPFNEPYLVMEFVDGVRLTEYCDQQKLDLESRVRLFIRACAGVTFAHRNLILHRDLKPSNILVTADGVPKVVDFGTAALLQPDRLTTISRAPLTPAYASPEQLTSRPVGTASDQYSLGLVLFELLTGSPAVPQGTSLIGAVERALAGVEPPAPHLSIAHYAPLLRGTTAAKLKRQLSGDLGTIVRKSLANDSGARYASVEHLVDDLERVLRREPILGRAQSLRYRAARFFARHRVAVVGAAVLIVSLLAATGISFQQARIARRESAKARELNRFMTTMLSSANPIWANPNAFNSSSVTVRQALDGAAELLAGQSLDPDVEAEVRRVVGGAYVTLAAFDQAQVQLEKALALSTGTGDALGVATTQMQLGALLTARGDFSGAESIHRKSVAYFRGAGRNSDPGLRSAVLGELGAAIGYQRPGDPEAIALMRESTALGDSIGSAVVPVMQHNLAIQLIRAGNLQEGETAVRDSLRRMNAMAKQLPERASTLRTLAVLLWQKGQYAEAEPLARESVEFAIRTRPPNHPLLPNNKSWWARTLASLGKGEEALRVSQDAYDSYARLRPAGHQDLVLPLICLGASYRVLGKLQESETYLRQANQLIRKFPAQRDRTADAAGELGLTLRAMGRTAEADGLLSESHAILQKAYGDDHPLVRQAKERLPLG